MPNIPAIKARFEAAIPSPWTLRREEPDVDVMSGETVIASMGDFYPEAEFVAHARTDIPVLVQALEEAHQELAEMRNQFLSEGPFVGWRKRMKDSVDAILGESG